MATQGDPVVALRNRQTVDEHDLAVRVFAHSAPTARKA
jgi:hypothetical protein